MQDPSLVFHLFPITVTFLHPSIHSSIHPSIHSSLSTTAKSIHCLHPWRVILFHPYIIGISSPIHPFNYFLSIWITEKRDRKKTIIRFLLLYNFFPLWLHLIHSIIVSMFHLPLLFHLVFHLYLTLFHFLLISSPHGSLPSLTHSLSQSIRDHASQSVSQSVLNLYLPGKTQYRSEEAFLQTTHKLILNPRPFNVVLILSRSRNIYWSRPFRCFIFCMIHVPNQTKPNQTKAKQSKPNQTKSNLT